jgi:hypothetical protein
MTALSPVEVIAVLAIAGGFMLLLAGMAWIADRKKDAPVAQPLRLDRHVPARERALLGDDWRDPIRPYFRQRWEGHLRKRLAIAATCGADPDLPSENNEDRAATTAGPQDKGATSNASTED